MMPVMSAGCVQPLRGSVRRIMRRLRRGARKSWPRRLRLAEAPALRRQIAGEVPANYTGDAAWLPAPLAAAACAALAALMGWPASPATPRLSEALPPLFEEAPAGSGAAELFAGLGPVPVSFMSLQSPSDVLLPASLAADPGFN